ncbi:DMT family transporter [Coralloluteibacterium stylophorae]|uniref:DMT family transporter n=1 Tax=Coralloluteibacterium stylophorae TaxID=1776034 RepID=A0A8J7VSC6_9GAMM|nr:DMT family transporter [Coralloluteibacterium stylophorae]MBS7457877.1 DMT family transporter [Coralloluteibacterium stylophorae]
MPPRDLLLVTLVCLAWAGNFLTSAYSLQTIPPFLFTALRLGLLAVLLAPFLRAPAPGQWPRLVAVCLCNGVLHFGLSFWALQTAGNLSSPAIVAQCYVPMAALLAWPILGERFAWRTALAIAVSFAGVLVLGFDPLVLAAPLSLALMLVSAFFLALGTVLMRPLRGLGPFAMQGWTATIGIVPLLAISMAIEPGGFAAAAGADVPTWLGVAYSALVASLVGHGLYYVLVQRHPIAQLTPWLLATPLFATALGVAFWGDRPGPRLYLGGAMLLGGVLLIALRAQAKSRPVPPASEA